MCGWHSQGSVSERAKAAYVGKRSKKGTCAWGDIALFFFSSIINDSASILYI